MLLLERCLDDAIRIGTDVTVKVLRIAHTRVLIGIDAPRSMPVWRDEIAPARAPAAPLSTIAPAPFRVLVVEDDPIHARLMRAALRHCNVSDLEFVTTGEEAIRLLDDKIQNQKPLPDLVLSDFRLPGMCGLDVLKEVKSRPVARAVPVVLISSMADDQDVAESVSSGANAFLTKPGNFEEFRESIARIAEFWRQNRRVA
jgi:carbon storage regulator CsrA